jgi:hypothetical protein
VVDPGATRAKAGDHRGGCDDKEGWQMGKQGISRARFLAGAGTAVTAGALAGSAGAREPRRGAAAGPSTRARAAQAATSLTHFLYLDQEPSTIGRLRDTSGGDPFGEVFEEGGAPFPDKHIAQLGFMDLVLTSALSLRRPYYGHLEAFTRGESPLFGGRIVRATGTSVISELTFTAGVFELALPSMDARDGATSAFITAKLAMGAARRRPTTGAAPQAPAQRAWRRNGFRLTISGLEGESRQVTTIESLTVKRPAGASYDVSNLVVTLPEAQAQGFFAWHRDFLITGRGEKQATLEYLNPNGNVILGTVSLSGLGITRLTPVSPPEPDGVPRLRATMYCERAEVTIPGT